MPPSFRFLAAENVPYGPPPPGPLQRQRRPQAPAAVHSMPPSLAGLIHWRRPQAPPAVGWEAVSQQRGFQVRKAPKV